MKQPWDGIVSEEDQRASRAAGFGRPAGVGSRPALLIIDVQYRTTGTRPMPFWDAVKEFPTSCGEVAWRAVANIKLLVAEFRRNRWPILYPHVAPKQSYDTGRLVAKAPLMMTVPQNGYDFVAEIAPVEGDCLIPKMHPSAFFGTPLVSYLVDREVDTLVVTGCTTSGCIRSSVVDAFSYNFRVMVPEDCVYDRSAASHAVNLFDMNEKYSDVMPLSAILERLKKVSAKATV